MVGRLKYFFNQIVWPGYYASKIDKRYLTPRYNEITEVSDFEFPEDNVHDLIEQLKKEIKDQAERKKGLEDKIKAILFVISLSITAITFCLKDLEWNRGSFLNAIGLITIALSILYFLFSALGSIKALIPIPFHEAGSKIIHDSEGRTIRFEKAGNEVQILLKSKLLNDTINIRVQNTACTVLQYLKNGMVLFAVFFGIALLQKISKKPVTESKVVSNLQPIVSKIPTIIKNEVGIPDKKPMIFQDSSVAKRLQSNHKSDTLGQKKIKDTTINKN